MQYSGHLPLFWLAAGATQAKIKANAAYSFPLCTIAHDEKQMLWQKKEFQEVHRFELKQLEYRKISEQPV